jgi:hypothetical protein
MVSEDVEVDKCEKARYGGFFLKKGCKEDRE